MSERKKSVGKLKKKFKPGRIIALPSKDKVCFQDEWNMERDPLDIPTPFRAVLCALPNGGKTNLVKQILSCCDFDEIYIIHCDPETTDDYDGIDTVSISRDIPDISIFRNSRDIKKCLILEDMNLEYMNRVDKTALGDLFKNVSSHENLSIIYTAHDPISIPLGARRLCDVFCLWKCPDLIALYMMARRTGYDIEDFKKMFAHIKGRHDFIMIDQTEGSPYPLRKNGYEMITI